MSVSSPPTTEPTPGPWRVRPALTLAPFLGASFWGAFLLFLVQPMVGKMVLPRFGGVPAVWNTCQLFFQAALLAGYGYAYLLAARLPVRAQVGCHLAVVLLPVLVLPIALPAGFELGDGSPVGPLLGLLAVTVGLPFLVVATTAPLIQRWYAASGGPGASDPYFLYALSNLGSLLALLGYPLLIEPHLTLTQQARLWAGGFAVLVALLAWAGLVVRRAPDPTNSAGLAEGTSPAGAAAPAPPIPMKERARWILLAFVPSCLLLAVTTHITTDLAPVPLLWVVPLALYLLSFVLAFLNLPGWVRPVTAWVFLGALVLAYGVAPGTFPRTAELSLHLVLFFAAALMLHGELARRRPPPEQLTAYYFCMSLGGVLGGVTVALLAPLVLDGYYEYPAALVLVCLLMPSPLRFTPRQPNRRDRYAAVAAAVAALALIVWRGERDFDAEVIYRSRNFFGVLTVANYTMERRSDHSLMHGTTRHGRQLIHRDPAIRTLPRAYYFPTGPIGQVFEGNLRRGLKPPVAVIGLGTGTLASYAEPGQEFTFFEIDPDVVKVARDPKYFTYLTDCPGRVRIRLGDARQVIAREPAGYYGLIVVDAFSSDAIPTHLVTAEALEVYLDKLTGDGLIAFHISNKWVDLEPVLEGLTRARGLSALIQADNALTNEELSVGKEPSTWVVLARTPQGVRHLAADRRWQPLVSSSDCPVWTDDFSNLFAVLRFGPDARAPRSAPGAPP
jgi:spermidine synthase